MDPDNELETLSRLREAMEQAKALYEGAKDGFEQAKHRSSELGASHPDGSVSYAAKVYTHCLRNYASAVFRFNRYVLDGKLPDEEAARSE